MSKQDYYRNSSFLMHFFPPSYLWLALGLILSAVSLSLSYCFTSEVEFETAMLSVYMLTYM